MIAPAWYAFLIWIPIHLSFLIYAVYQLLPSQLNEPLYNRLAIPYMLANLLSTVRIFCYRFDWLVVSEVLVAGMVVVVFRLYMIGRNAVLKGDAPRLLSWPFALLGSWLLAVTVANTSILLDGFGFGVAAQEMISVFMLLVIMLAGIYTGYRCGDFIFPLVVSWYCFAVFLAIHTSSYLIAVTALATAVLPLIWTVTTVLNHVYHRHKAWANKYHLGKI
jgi:hypothetical protein